MASRRLQATLYHGIPDDAAILDSLAGIERQQDRLRVLVSIGTLDNSPFPSPSPASRPATRSTTLVVRLYDTDPLQRKAINTIDKLGIGTLKRLLRRGLRLESGGKLSVPAPAATPTLPRQSLPPPPSGTAKSLGGMFS